MRLQSCLLVLGLFGLFGCSVIPTLGGKEEREEQVYFLETASLKEVMNAADAASDLSCGSVVVNDIVSAPGFGGSQMRYSVEPLRLRHYAYARWADNPARMLRTVIVDGLANSGVFSEVLPAPTVATTDLRLEISNLQILQTLESMQASNSVATLSGDYRLFQVQPATLLGAESFSLSLPATPNSAGNAQAVNELASRLMVQLRTELPALCRAQ